MKFLVGLATGIVLGAAGAVAYSIKTGTDLRESLEGVRADLEKRDLDALSARFESGLSELQAVMDERLNQIKASTASAIEEANRAIEDGRAAVASAAGDSANGVADMAAEAGDAADSAATTAESVFSDASEGATAFATEAADAAGDLADGAAGAVEETLDVAADTLEETREG
jgi:gas vesicle protein